MRCGKVARRPDSGQRPRSRLAHDAAAVVLLQELVDRHAERRQLVHIDHLG
jgi:hypothetical protein